MYFSECCDSILIRFLAFVRAFYYNDIKTSRYPTEESLWIYFAQIRSVFFTIFMPFEYWKEC